MSGIHYNHYICMDCDIHVETDFFYPDKIPMCDQCRIKNKVFNREYYENLTLEKLK